MEAVKLSRYLSSQESHVLPYDVAVPGRTVEVPLSAYAVVPCWYATRSIRESGTGVNLSARVLCRGKDFIVSWTV